MEKAINEKFHFFKKIKTDKLTKKDYWKMFFICTSFVLVSDLIGGVGRVAYQLDNIFQNQQYEQAKEARHYKNFYSNESYELKDLKSLIVEQNSSSSSLLLSQAVMKIKTDPNISDEIKKQSIDLYNQNYLLGVNRQQYDFSKLHCSYLEPMCQALLHYVDRNIEQVTKKTVGQLEINKKAINSEGLEFDDKNTTLLIEENKF